MKISNGIIGKRGPVTKLSFVESEQEWIDSADYVKPIIISSRQKWIDGFEKMVKNMIESINKICKKEVKGIIKA